MADEPSRDESPKYSGSVATPPPRIEPGPPTPNRDKPRPAMTLDLKAEPEKLVTPSAPREPTAPPMLPSETVKADAADGKPGTTASSASASASATPAGAGTASASADAAKAKPVKAEPPKADAPRPDPIKRDPPRPSLAAAAKPAVPVPPPPVAPRRRSPLPFLLTLVLAAIIAFGVFYAYQMTTDPGAGIAALKAEVADLRGRIDGVGKQVEGLPNQAALSAFDEHFVARSTVAALEHRVAAAEATVSTFDKRIAAGQAGIDQRLNAFEAARAEAAEALDKRLQTLEATRNEVTAVLEKRVAALEALTTTLGAQIDQANTKAEVVRIQAARAVEAVAKASATPPGAPIVLPPTVDIAPVNARINQIEAKIAAFDKQIEAKVAALEAALAKPKTETRATEARAVVDQPKPDAVAIAIVAQALLQAFEQGSPYAIELAKIRALGAGDKAAALQPFAERGAPTLKALTAQFIVLRPTILAAAMPPPSGSFLDRIAEGASGLVTVRATGDAAGTGSAPAALVASIETFLERGDADAGLTAWKRLPPPAQKVSQAWADQLKGRVAAEGAARSLAAESLDALGKPKS